jgi:hypothetical protein
MGRAAGDVAGRITISRGELYRGPQSRRSLAFHGQVRSLRSYSVQVLGPGPTDCCASVAARRGEDCDKGHSRGPILSLSRPLARSSLSSLARPLPLLHSPSSRRSAFSVVRFLGFSPFISASLRSFSILFSPCDDTAMVRPNVAGSKFTSRGGALDPGEPPHI